MQQMTGSGDNPQQMGEGNGARAQMECKGIFGAKPPPLQPVVRMPDQQDPAILEARRKQQADMRARGGRDSTILSDNLGSGKL